MKVQLSVCERILLANGVLPSENNFVTLRIVRKIKERIGFAEDELKMIDMKFDSSPSSGTSCSWDVSKENPKEYEFNDMEIDIIKNALIDIDRNKKATVNHLSLFEKFNI